MFINRHGDREECIQKKLYMALRVMTDIEKWMRSSRMVRASGYQCRSRNSPGLQWNLRGGRQSWLMNQR
jgi:hypothetical protein